MRGVLGVGFVLVGTALGLGIVAWREGRGERTRGNESNAELP